jgi:nucleoside-diphosphate-sugar epimerase
MGTLANDSNLSFVVIPDMTVQGVFKQPVQQADYVIHVASPLWTSDMSLPAHELYEHWVEPAVASTVGILEAALQNPRIKEVVLTSSAGALTTLDRCFGDNVDGIVYTANSRVPDSEYETIKEDPIEHYMASKALSLNATDKFVAEKSPPFAVINVVPTSVIGRFEMARTPEQLLANSNVRGLGIAVGQKVGKVPIGVIHVDDLAKFHVDVLKMETPKYISLGASLKNSFPEQAESVKKHFPEAVKDGRFSMDGEVVDRPFELDTQETEKFLGWKFQSFDVMVKTVGEQYLELLAKAGA